MFLNFSSVFCGNTIFSSLIILNLEKRDIVKSVLNKCETSISRGPIEISLSVFSNIRSESKPTIYPPSIYLHPPSQTPINGAPIMPSSGLNPKQMEEVT